MKTMSDLVIIENNQTFTTSLAIAEGMNVEHRAILQLIRKYQDDFEDENLVTFEMRPRLEGRWGGGDVNVAILDEYQAALLLTYMRNTAKVRLFKQALVKAFFKARDLLMAGQMGLLQVQAALYAERNSEKQAASAYGKGLSDWKRKRDALDDAIFKVERQIQPQLTNFE